MNPFERKVKLAAISIEVKKPKKIYGHSMYCTDIVQTGFAKWSYLFGGNES